MICVRIGRSDIESAGDAGRHFARTRGAHRYVEREHKRAATGGFRAVDEIAADGVVVGGQPVELKPEDIRRDARHLFDGGTAGRGQRIRNAGALRRAGQMKIAARPDNRRAAHRRDADRRVVAATEQLHLAGRQLRHDAVARHELDSIESGPIAPDAGILLAGTAVGIFKGEMRDMAAGALPQIVDSRIMPVKLRIARTCGCTRRPASPAARFVAR